MCMHSCFCKLFLNKNFSSEIIDWIFTKFEKNCSSPFRKKLGLWSDTGTQAPLVLSANAFSLVNPI